MARLPRVVVAGAAHVVVHRARKGHKALTDSADAQQYLHSLKAAVKEYGVAVHGYGLGAEEVRLLLTPRTAADLAALMRSVGRRFVHGFNARHGLSGTPWEGRFRSCVIQAPQELLGCLRFVEMADGAATTSDAPCAPLQGSAAHHLGHASDPLIQEHAVYWALGNTPFDRQARYAQAVADGLDAADAARIASAVRAGWPLGSPDFVAQVGRDSGRRTTPGQPGRPRKSAAKPARTSCG